MVTLENEFGKIKITKKAITRCISEAIAAFEYEIFPTTAKGKVVPLKSRGLFNDLSREVEINYTTEKGLEIKFYLLLRFGMSINAVTNRIFDTLISEMQACFGFAPTKITIGITGMYSKDLKKNS